MRKSITLWLTGAIALISSFGLVTSSPAFAAGISPAVVSPPMPAVKIVTPAVAGVIDGSITFHYLPVCDPLPAPVASSDDFCQLPQNPIAHITATNRWTGFSSSTSSDSNGNYTLRLPTGWYTVSIAVPSPCVSGPGWTRCSRVMHTSSYNIFVLAPFHFHHHTDFNLYIR